MTLSRVQLAASGSITTGTSFVLTGFPSNIPVGDFLVIWVNTGAGRAVSGSDNSTQAGAANSYTRQGFATSNLTLLTCPITRQIQTTDTITLSWAGAITHATVLIEQYHSTNGAVSFDAVGTDGSSGIGSTSLTTGFVTTVASSGMIAAGLAYSGASGITLTSIGGGTASTNSAVLEDSIFNSFGSSGAADAQFTSQGTARAVFGFPSATGSCYGACCSITEPAAAASSPPFGPELTGTPSGQPVYTGLRM